MRFGLMYSFIVPPGHAMTHLDTFREIFDGELSPTSAYMTGRMTIEGDMSVAMKLSQVLG